jgi:integrase
LSELAAHGSAARLRPGISITPPSARDSIPASTSMASGHVVASYLVDEDAHPRVIMARLGHSTQRLSMELYSHVSNDLDRRIGKQPDATFEHARVSPHAEAADSDSTPALEDGSIGPL